MESKLLLLGLLRQHGMHGYQLYEFIERDLSICTDLKKSTAYFLLGRMAEDGWIEETQAQEGNRPPRRVYTLTELGEVEYQRLLRQNLADYAPAFFDGDTGLAFIDSLDPQVGRDMLMGRRQHMANALADLEAVPDHAGSLQYVVDHRRHHLQAELEWLDALLMRLEQR
jgi:DNA-binding PadR family transcriptional regulator